MKVDDLRTDTWRGTQNRRKRMIIRKSRSEVLEIKEKNECHGGKSQVTKDEDRNGDHSIFGARVLS